MKYSFRTWRIGVLVCVFLLFGVLPVTVMAGDTTNIAITVKDLGDRVLLSCDLKNFTTPIEDAFSQAYDLAGIDPSRGSIQVWGLQITNRDVNVFIEGSNSLEDTTFSSFYTRPEFDDVDATPDTGTSKLSLPGLVVQQFAGTGDTVHVQIKDPALYGRYVRFKADGQAGNVAGSITYVRAVLFKVDQWWTIPGGIAQRDWEAVVDTN